MSQLRNTLARAAHDIFDVLGLAVAAIIRGGPPRNDRDDDPEDEKKDDTRDILCSIQDALTRVEHHSTHLKAELQHRAIVPRLFGNVLVLWKDTESGAPRALSHTVRLNSSETEYALEIQAHRVIPEGAWVVAHNCDLTAVYMGHESCDLGPSPRGRMVALTKPIGVGNHLRLIVQREK